MERSVMNTQTSLEMFDIKLHCDVLHILKMLLHRVMQPPPEWASSTSYFSQSDASLWHSLLLNWPTTTERTADLCVEADLSSTQPAQERQRMGLQREWVREKGWLVQKNLLLNLITCILLCISPWQRWTTARVKKSLRPQSHCVTSGKLRLVFQLML